jgi:hypothetical protein
MTFQSSILKKTSTLLDKTIHITPKYTISINCSFQSGLIRTKSEFRVNFRTGTKIGIILLQNQTQYLFLKHTGSRSRKYNCWVVFCGPGTCMFFIKVKNYPTLGSFLALCLFFLFFWFPKFSC